MTPFCSRVSLVSTHTYFKHSPMHNGQLIGFVKLHVSVCGTFGSKLQPSPLFFLLNLCIWSFQGRFRLYQSTTPLSLPDAGAYFSVHCVLEEFKHTVTHKAVWREVIAGPSPYCAPVGTWPLFYCCFFLTTGNNGRAGGLFSVAYIACELGSHSGHSFISCLILA